jgi:hypothetical protein
MQDAVYWQFLTDSPEADPVVADILPWLPDSRSSSVFRKQGVGPIDGFHLCSQRRNSGFAHLRTSDCDNRFDSDEVNIFISIHSLLAFIH